LIDVGVTVTPESKEYMCVWDALPDVRENSTVSESLAASEPITVIS